MIRPVAGFRTITTLLLTVAGGVLPVSAQIDLAGEWAAQLTEDQPHRIPGPDLGDYTGLPINDAARLKARTWDASVLSQPERQAQPHPAPYSMRGPGPNFRMGKIVDPRTDEVIGYSVQGLFGNADRTIWLDGRPHPSEIAEHTWDGFSTGVWEGGALKVTTTHMKAGFIQRNGVPTSPYATMTEFFIRHGDHLLLATIIDDPIYLEEPFVRTSNFVWAPTQTQARPAPFEVVDELADRPRGWVPSYPLGTLHEDFAERVGLLLAATVGGKDSLYPEFASQIAATNRGPSATPAPAKPGPSRPPPRRRTDFEVLPLRYGLYMLAGPSGNVTLQSTDEGLLLVDTGAAADIEKLVAAIKTLSDRPVTYIVNTSADADHVGGNDKLSQAGSDLGGNAPGNFGFRIGVAPIVAHEQVLRRISAPTGEKPAMPFAAWPTSTYMDHRDVRGSGVSKPQPLAMVI